MSPVRHEDGFRGRPIKSWESWIDEAIEKARERGDFDDLPGHGKPLRLETNIYEPEMNLAYSTLKNAGYAPTWMELDRKITLGRADLDDFLERSATFLASLREEIVAGTTGVSTPVQQDEAAVTQPAGWMRRIWQSVVGLLNFASEPTVGPSRPLPTLADLDAIRQRMRAQYLERAATLDKGIAEFHAALPRNLWHLERSRLTQETAAHRFDDRMAGTGEHQATDS